MVNMVANNNNHNNTISTRATEETTVVRCASVARTHSYALIHSPLSLHFCLYDWLSECFVILFLSRSPSLTVCVVCTVVCIVECRCFVCCDNGPKHFVFFFQSIFRHRTLVGAFNFQSSIFCVLFYFCSFIDGHTKRSVVAVALSSSIGPPKTHETKLCRNFQILVVRMKQILVLCIDFSLAYRSKVETLNTMPLPLWNMLEHTGWSSNHLIFRSLFSWCRKNSRRQRLSNGVSGFYTTIRP